MVGNRFERPLDPRVSPYLQRPLRTLKEAEHDNDASGYHAILAPFPPDSPASPGHRDAASPRTQSWRINAWLLRLGKASG